VAARKKNDQIPKRNVWHWSAVPGGWLVEAPCRPPRNVHHGKTYAEPRMCCRVTRVEFNGPLKFSLARAKSQSYHIVAQASDAWASAKLGSISSVCSAKALALPQPSSGETNLTRRVRRNNQRGPRTQPHRWSLWQSLAGNIGQLFQILLAASVPVIRPLR